MADRPSRPRRRKPGSPTRSSSGRFTGQRHIVIGGEDAQGNTVWVIAVDVDDPDALDEDALFRLMDEGINNGQGSPPRGARYISTAPITQAKIYRPSLRRRPVILPEIRRSDFRPERPPETRSERKPRTRKR